MTSFPLEAPCVDHDVFGKLHKVRELMIEKELKARFTVQLLSLTWPPPVTPLIEDIGLKSTKQIVQKQLP